MAAFLGALSGTIDNALRVQLEANKGFIKTKALLKAHAPKAYTVQKAAVFLGFVGVVALIALAVNSEDEEGRGKIGTALMTATAPVSLMSYNVYQASENLRSQVLESPERLMDLTDLNGEIPVDPVALRRCLLQKTICFEPFLRLYLKIVLRSELDLPEE